MGGTRFTGFDVLAERRAWDPFTRSIVLQRLKPPRPAALSEQEASTLRAVLRVLLCEEREEILDFAVAHVDGRVGSTTGEGQRKPGVPPEAELIRRGLAVLEAAAGARHGLSFAKCDARAQIELVAALQKEEVPGVDDFPQKESFKKLLGLAVDACASHPAVWSEMGYAGPAYPRGYYRLDRQSRDPWEPEFAGSLRHAAGEGSSGADGGDRHGPRATGGRRERDG